jgi:hypothetical protein
MQNDLRVQDSSAFVLPQDYYILENEFLFRLAGNLRKRFYTVSKEELDELKRIALLHIEPLCDYLVRDLEPKPVTYVSKGGYYIIQSLASISLATGRIFGGSYEEGSGDPIYLWTLFKQTSFVKAVEGLADWCLDFRERAERHRRSLCVPKLPLDELKELVWKIFEEFDLISGEKVLFRKGNGKNAQSTAWISARGLWKVVLMAYGETASEVTYFASPHKLKELLDIWKESNCFRYFRVNRQWRPRGVNMEQATRIEYSFTPTGYPLDPLRE